MAYRKYIVNPHTGKLDRIISQKELDEHSVTDTDIVRNEVLAFDTGLDKVFTLANTPVDNTVNIYLNGMLQEQGAGEDYTISGSTITFAVAVNDTDIVIADYIIA